MLDRFVCTKTCMKVNYAGPVFCTITCMEVKYAGPICSH